MARKAVRKRKSHKGTVLLYFTVTLLMISSIVYLASALFLRQYNNSLSTDKQRIEDKIIVIQQQNDEMKVEIAKLTSSDRVDEIAVSSGMSRNQENIVTLIPEEEPGD